MIKLINEKRKMPVITIDAIVLRDMAALIKECNTEIGWLALSEKLEKDLYHVYEIIPVKQEVSSVTTDLMEDGLQEVYDEMVKAGRENELNNIRFWGHSHVNMLPTPSAQDEETFEEYMKNCEDYFIRFIMNKKGDYTLDLADYEDGIIYKDLKYSILYSGNELDINNEIIKKENEIKQLKEEMKKLKEDAIGASTKWAKDTINKYLIKKPHNLSNSAYVYNNSSSNVLYKKNEIKNEITQDDNFICGLLVAYYTDTNYLIKCGKEEKVIGDVLAFDIIDDLCILTAYQARYKYEDMDIFKGYEYIDWQRLVETADEYMNDYYHLQETGEI